MDLSPMRAYFQTGETRACQFRKAQLNKLKKTVIAYESAIKDALYTDLKKSPEEAWITESGFVLSEINYALAHVAEWMDRQSVRTAILNLPSRSFILHEPLGVVLIIGPWNYPLQLLLTPLVGAIAAGNCVVLKPSEFAPATGAVMKKIITETFDPKFVRIIDGVGAEVIPAMMNDFVFDHIFYTGSTTVGKIIYQLAAKNLVPVTLELGGKSPCIVEADADITVTAKRIAATKFSNAGQMCVAPDYVLVHESKKAELLNALRLAVKRFFGEDAAASADYGRIVNENQFDRLTSYLQQGSIVTGGRTSREDLYIEPTILDEVSLQGSIMKDEIFGPILPVISFKTSAEAKEIIAQNKNPLALYIFTSSRNKEKDWLTMVPFGGGCINNASFHLFNHQLPFGGRGFSGTGSYHGRFSFDTFSHKKGIMKSPTWFDPAARYPPYAGKLKMFRWMLK
jgi:aldehyde dehydrogenase (NAD+)